jgi:hypothetical protein
VLSEPQQLAADVSTITETAFDRSSTKPTEARDVLKFVNKLVQVVDDALGEVMETLIEFKYVTPDDLSNGWSARIADLEKLLASRTYRQAADICERLQDLESYYYAQLAPIVGEVSDINAWTRVLTLLHEHERGIVTVVDQTIADLCAICVTATDASLPTIRSLAAGRVEEVREALTALRKVRGNILGLSGSAGLLELIGETTTRPVTPQ